MRGTDDRQIKNRPCAVQSQGDKKNPQRKNQTTQRRAPARGALDFREVGCPLYQLQPISGMVDRDTLDKRPPWRSSIWQRRVRRRRDQDRAQKNAGQKLDRDGRYAGMSDVDPAELKQAQNLFRDFQYRAPRGQEIITVGGLVKPVVALAVGTAVSIGYKALGDGKDYYHEFEGARPKVFVNAAGDQIYFLGGEYRFTRRGFIK